MRDLAGTMESKRVRDLARTCTVTQEEVRELAGTVTGTQEVREMAGTVTHNVRGRAHADAAAGRQ